MTSEPPTGPRRNSSSASRSSSHSPSRSSAATRSQSTLPASHLALGAEGEARAASYLASKGYRIVARNVRAGGVELDLIVRRGRSVIFVEVKTRRSQRFGPPELAVDAAKRRRLVAGAAAWLRECGRGFEQFRFDVVAWQVTPSGRGEEAWRLRHFENAFEANDSAADA